MRRFIAGLRASRFLAAEEGTTAIEYAIIASGIAGVLIATVTTLGGSVSTMWTTIGGVFQ
jgi:pilus assembly protein Flp/PilA